MFTVVGNRIFALYFFWLTTVREMCALQVLFLEISLIVEPADVDVRSLKMLL